MKSITVHYVLRLKKTYFHSFNLIIIKQKFVRSIVTTKINTFLWSINVAQLTLNISNFKETEKKLQGIENSIYREVAFKIKSKT